MTSDNDYHWYRKDSNGYWSHKPGVTPVVNTDASGNLIKNIYNANYGMYKGGILVWIRKK